AIHSKNIVQIDEPFILYFEDGDRLDILYSEGSTVKVSMNTLRDDLISGINPNIVINPDDYFSEIHDRQITGIEIQRSNEYPEFTHSHGLDLDENQDEFIERILIYLSDGYVLDLSNFYDYGYVSIAREIEGRKYRDCTWVLWLRNSKSRFKGYKKGDPVKIYVKRNRFNYFQYEGKRKYADAYITGTFCKISYNEVVIEDVTIYEK
ncbi:MAG: hypothetical protein MJZ61_06925, partial [Bacteroidales bacterium]|nr:hypothetical protein [Bacteroidales bacterium]